MFSYPKRYPVLVKIVGLITDDSFQRVKYYVKLLQKSQKKLFLPPEITSLLEFEWMEYITRLCRDVGRKCYMRKTNAVVFWNDRFLGDSIEFQNVLSRMFQFKINWPVLMSFKKLGKEERKQFFSQNKGKSYIFFDLQYAGQQGRLVFELHSDLLPNTCAKFMKHCITHPMKERNESFMGSQINRICKNGWLQGGDINIPHELFADESYDVRHDQRGILSLCNKGKKNTNGTQFFVTFQPSAWMNGRYVAIGHLIEGYFVLSELENFHTTYEQPDTPIIVVNCGVLPYGRGIPVRNEFVDQVSKEVRYKWDKIRASISIAKQSKLPINIDSRFVGLQKELLEVDSNSYFLVAKTIQLTSPTLEEPTITQYLTAILLDIISQVVQLHNVREDVIDPRDVSSLEYDAEKYEQYLYSALSEYNKHFKELWQLCVTTGFFKKAQQLKDQLLNIKSFKKLNEKQSFSLRLSSSSKKSPNQPSASDSVSVIIDKAFEDILWLHDDNITLEKEEGDFNFDPIREIIEGLLTKVAGESEPATSKITDEKLLRIAVNFVKSLLKESLRTYRKRMKPSILKHYSSF